MKEKNVDFAVLGGGLMGSSAAWQLANANEKVLLIEQQGKEYTFGSSLGEARISRSLGPKYDIWSYLHRRAVSETEILLDFLNSEGDIALHKMEDIYTTSPSTYILHTDKKEVVDRMLRQQEDQYEFASSPSEAKEKFQVNLPEKQIVIQEYRRHTGTINPKVLISKLHTAIELKGSKVSYDKKIESVRKIEEQEGPGYEIVLTNNVDGQKEKILAKKVVCAAGAYTGSLLKDINPLIESVINPKRVALAFFKVASSRYKSYSSTQKQRFKNFYPAIDLGPRHHFSMIEKIDTDGIPIIKTGGHFQRNEITDLPNVWKKEVTEEEIAWTKTNVLAYFEFLDLPLKPEELIYSHGYSCVYSLTESEVPLLDLLPNRDNTPDPNFVLMGGMSGVGAKGSLTYGRMAANLLLGLNESHFMYKKTLQKLSFEGH